mgnify:CR=1 FL=1
MIHLIMKMKEKQLKKMQDYIKEHPKTSEEIIKSIDEKINELENR